MILCLDTEATVLTCPANQTKGTDHGQPTALVVWDKPVFDNSGHDSNVTCTSSSGTKFAIGLTIVECVAIDEAGNSHVCNFSIDVKGKLLCMK